jgi:hypothetical protein
MTTSIGGDKGPGGRPALRGALLTIAAIGVALVVMPLFFGMFAKTPKGADMIAGFKPYMTAARLSGYRSELHQINAGARQTDTTVATYLNGGAPSQTVLARKYPEFVSFDQQWPAIDSKMTGLMSQVHGNLGNYEDMAALPSFTLFPWFFVIPGLLIAGCAIGALIRPPLRRRLYSLSSGSD